MKFIPLEVVMGRKKLEEMTKENSFAKELEHLINRFSEENASDTPDYILAQYLVACLEAWNCAVHARGEFWNGREIVESR